MAQSGAGFSILQLAQVIQIGAALASARVLRLPLVMVVAVSGRVVNAADIDDDVASSAASLVRMMVACWYSGNRLSNEQASASSQWNVPL
jgi:hypothetical protein